MIIGVILSVIIIAVSTFLLLFLVLFIIFLKDYINRPRRTKWLLERGYRHVRDIYGDEINQLGCKLPDQIN